MGPATFAGGIVQGSAELLSGLVLAQLVKPGAPFTYGAFTTLFDRKIYDVWLEEGCVKFDQRLRAKTEIIMNHQPESLRKDAVSKLEVMQKHWE